MTRTFALLMTFAFALNLSAKEPTPATKEASAAVRLALSSATSASVSEGLPHWSFERDLLATESKRRDTVKIDSSWFYTPAVEAKNTEVLKRLLASADSIKVSRGLKLGGGFHPDYAVHWADDTGSKFYAMICFRLREIIYSDGKKHYLYDLSDDAPWKLMQELEHYAKKRPKKNAQVQE